MQPCLSRQPVVWHQSEVSHAVPGDVADGKCVAEAAAAAHQDMGRIDILVNCAGVAGPVAPVESFPADEWVRVMRINLDGVFHCCRTIVPHMRKLG